MSNQPPRASAAATAAPRSGTNTSKMTNAEIIAPTFTVVLPRTIGHQASFDNLDLDLGHESKGFCDHVLNRPDDRADVR
jgi:hypothetical protein